MDWLKLLSGVAGSMGGGQQQPEQAPQGWQGMLPPSQSPRWIKAPSTQNVLDRPTRLYTSVNSTPRDARTSRPFRNREFLPLELQPDSVIAVADLLPFGCPAAVSSPSVSDALITMAARVMAFIINTVDRVSFVGAVAHILQKRRKGKPPASAHSNTFIASLPGDGVGSLAHRPPATPGDSFTWDSGATVPHVVPTAKDIRLKAAATFSMPVRKMYPRDDEYRAARAFAIPRSFWLIPDCPGVTQYRQPSVYSPRQITDTLIGDRGELNGIFGVSHKAPCTGFVIRLVRVLNASSRAVFSLSRYGRTYGN